MDQPMTLIETVLVVLGVGVGVVVLSQRLRMPSVVGFIFTGLVIGPYGARLITDPEATHLLSEIGVMLLLFSLGVEFSLEELLKLRRYIFRAGVVQVVVTGVCVAVGSLVIGFSLPESIALGMIVSLSSTAIGVKLLSQRAEMTSAHGMFAIAILLVQDIAAPVFMATMPLVASNQPGGASTIAVQVVIIGVAAVVLYLVARRVMPRLVHWLTTNDAREVSVLGSLFLALLMAFAAEQMGLSPALGAFLAGMIVSETPYRHQIVSNIAPFRDSFVALFFISVGLMVNVGALAELAPTMLGWTAALIALKSAIVLGVAWWCRLPLRIGVMGAALLANIGEFSFVLIGQAQNLLPEQTLQGMVVGTSLSIMLTPVLVALAHRISTRLVRQPSKAIDAFPAPPPLRDHVIIVGYGFNGRNLAAVLQRLQVPFVVVELNGALVRQAERDGAAVIYGDAADTEILDAAGIAHARAVVIAISDPLSTRFTLSQVRRLNRQVYVIARTRFVPELNELLAAGANDVVPEEFEAFVEITRRILEQLGIEPSLCEQIATSYRTQHYQTLRRSFERVEQD